MTQVHGCIVVGSGTAGLLAALTLHKAGRDVMLLEGRDRIGGRAHSAPLSDGTMAEQGSGLGVESERATRGITNEQRRST